MTTSLAALRIELLTERLCAVMPQWKARRRAQAEVARAIRRGRAAAKSPLTLQQMVTRLTFARMDREARS